ncbi:MAG: hypothetical protein IJA85_10040 [Clostridia bacterium]|nr:hypothetical protein [Clostridia bacterium]
MNKQDQQIIRELAKQYMEYACSEKQKAAVSRMKATNDLQIVRPPVLIDEIPWFEMNIDDELILRCEENLARSAEWHLRMGLYRCRHFKADAIIEPFFPVYKAFTSSGIGISVDEDIISTDNKNHIVSHCYRDVLEDEAAAEMIRLPIITPHPDWDAEHVAYFSELFGDSMPVILRGSGSIYSAPWDTLSSLRGVEPILMDMYERPEYLHLLMEKMTAAIAAEMDQVESLGLNDAEVPTVHCTPAYISDLGEKGWKQGWYRGMAQMFSTVSPAMHKEFEIDYIKPLAERCAYSYYGCCEPLDNKMEVIREISNLRKIGVSPWSNVEVCAEQIGGDFVYARKPNPAFVALDTDPETVRREIEDTVKACLRHGCPCEFVLKDISTVSYKPHNLIFWSEVVSDVLDRYYE